MSDFEFIKFEKKEQTAVITFNRPDCYNAMNRAMKLEIIAAIKQANKDESVRSIILTGEGKAFSSGQDLNDRTVKAEDGPVDLGVTLRTEWNPLVNAVTNSDKIILAAINGVCAGAGLSVALSCDLLISKPKVKFVSGFAQIGLAPDAGSGHILANRIGYQKSLEFFLTGMPLMAEQLQEAGLINSIEDNVLEKTLEMSKVINALAPLSVKQIKKNLFFAINNDRTKTIERETYVQRFLGNSKDYSEGVKAFFEKRKPNFEGK